MKRWWFGAAVASVALIASACAHETGFGVKVEGGLGNQAMMTNAQEPDVTMTSAIEGQLAWTEDNCLGLALPSTGEVAPAVFPSGTVFLPEWDGIMLTDGTQILIGEYVEFNGGFAEPADDIMRHVPLNCHVEGDIPILEK